MTMTRAPPPPLPNPSGPDLTTSPPPSPPPPQPPKNPWRIHHSGGGGDATVTLMGEPSSSWPALTSCQRRNGSPSPPPPPEFRPVESESPGTTDLISSSASTSSSELPSHVEVASLKAAAAAAAPPPPLLQPASTSPSPVPTPVPPPSPRNADHPPPRPSAPHNRRGRNNNPRFHNHRGNGGPRPNNNYNHANNSYNHRPPAPGWRPNWQGDFSSVPQYPNWGFYPGSSVGVVPQAMHPYLVPYPQPYNGLVYSDYGTEPFGTYYDQSAYEVPYAPPMSPGVAGTPPPQPVPSFPAEVSRDRQVNTLKAQLLSQIEYYFSNENLVKDAYLKLQMDNQGWVDVHKIASFKKVVSLTEDMSLIKDALQSSNVVEIQGDKLRKRLEWHKWILPQSSSPKENGAEHEKQQVE